MTIVLGKFSGTEEFLASPEHIFAQHQGTLHSRVSILSAHDPISSVLYSVSRG